MSVPRLRELAVLAALVVCGLTGTLVALADRGADTQFLAVQQHPPRLAAAEVERVVRTAPDPAVGRGSGTGASCRPLGDGRLRNPWACTVRYRSGRSARVRVIVGSRGRYTGRFAAGGAVEGCCVQVP